MNVNSEQPLKYRYAQSDYSQYKPICFCGKKAQQNVPELVKTWEINLLEMKFHSESKVFTVTTCILSGNMDLAQLCSHCLWVIFALQSLPLLHALMRSILQRQHLTVSLKGC